MSHWQQVCVSGVGKSIRKQIQKSERLPLKLRNLRERERTCHLTDRVEEIKGSQGVLITLSQMAIILVSATIFLLFAFDGARLALSPSFQFLC